LQYSYSLKIIDGTGYPEIFEKSYEFLDKLLVKNQKENGVNWNVQNVLGG